MTDTMQGLNSKQIEAVQTINGPMLILAGAGSGKTKVLTCRIAHLLQQGVRPYRILAITFTNKAASEIKTRLAASFDDPDIPNAIWAGTFHSICMRILRVHAERIGYKKEFTIYDTEDTKKTISAAMKELNVDEKALSVFESKKRIKIFTQEDL